MLRFRCLAIVSALVALTHCGPTSTPSIEETLTNIQNDLNELLDFKNSIQQTIGGLARQMMLQQLYVEERIRSDGGSGIKQIRSSQGGTRPYHFTTASTSAVNAIHEHSNYNNTIGMGEIVAVLNGLEFRTRHNDYKLVMPSTKSNKYNEVEHVPLPDIPPSVLAKTTIDEQIHEMQQYFKAFHTQDTKIRNYKPYFKPALCYLEGGWTTDTKTLSEPFESDRHFLDAKSWFDMQQKVLYTASNGGKSQFENYSYLPTTIINVTDDGQAVYAQWNYRIVCHPIQQDLRLQDLQLVDDLAARMLLNKNFTAHGKSKAARFSIAPYESYGYEAEKEYGHYSDRRFLHGRIDDIMYEIPGKENYNGYLEDESFGLTKYRVDTKNTTLLNVARYHRHFKVMRTGAMGLTVRNRGFSDPYLFVAKTQNPKIASISAEECVKSHGKENCTMYEARHTYAIPLEIIWMTPLNKWNPYNLTFHQDNKIPQADGRKGGMTPEKAFNGTSSNTYYLTPVEFFSSGETARDPADTAKDGVGVLDESGTVSSLISNKCIVVWYVSLLNKNHLMVLRTVDFDNVKLGCNL